MRTIASQANERAFSPPAKCDICTARFRALCSTLTGEQLERLSGMGRRRTVPPNHYIFRDGDEAQYFASILSGVVKLVKTTADGEQHIMGLMIPPEDFGHTLSKHHRFSAAAATEVELCTFPRAPFSLLGRLSADRTVALRLHRPRARSLPRLDAHAWPEMLL